MEWLAKKLKFRSPADWHRARGADFQANGGGGLLELYFDKSIFRAVRETFPEQDWHEWLFKATPRGFWLEPENRARFLKWLGEELGFSKPDDWYGITTAHFVQHGGQEMLVKDGSPAQIVMDAVPNHDWKPWLFAMVPPNFWAEPANRRRYMDWLAARLGFRKPQDWYAVTLLPFTQNSGIYMLDHYFDMSIVAALREYIPDYDWKPWLFAATAKRFWKDPKNRQQYLDWLGQNLGFRTPDDWRALQHDHLAANFGMPLLKFYRRSLATAMREYWPEHEWEEWYFPVVGAGCWKHRGNRVRYLHWLSVELGLRKPDDWYGLTSATISRNRGSQLLGRYYGGSVSRMLRDLLPHHDWLDWKFSHIPRGFFNKAANRARYLDWLFLELKIRRPEDWYVITREEIRATGGGGLFEVMKGLGLALREWRPDEDWKEWLFAGKKQDYWKSPEVRRRYLQWLAVLLEYRRPEDWLRIRSADFLSHRGEVLLRRYRGSAVRAVLDSLPELGFQEEDFEATMVKSRRKRRPTPE